MFYITFIFTCRPIITGLHFVINFALTIWMAIGLHNIVDVLPCITIAGGSHENDVRKTSLNVTAHKVPRLKPKPKNSGFGRKPLFW